MVKRILSLTRSLDTIHLLHRNLALTLPQQEITWSVIVSIYVKYFLPHWYRKLHNTIHLFFSMISFRKTFLVWKLSPDMNQTNLQLRKRASKIQAFVSIWYLSSLPILTYPSQPCFSGFFKFQPQPIKRTLGFTTNFRHVYIYILVFFFPSIILLKKGQGPSYNKQTRPIY